MGIGTVAVFCNALYSVLTNKTFDTPHQQRKYVKREGLVDGFLFPKYGSTVDFCVANGPG
jgi:hypothetical protein